ncbi:MAG TPA: hypothetical protein VJV05_08425 [Pyrinomonadaceae bacterium]|nr:hypothetical protein [Pyrinomonadaceae bacterium]
MKPLLILSVIAFVSFCSRPGERVAVADACQKDDGTLLLVEGFLRPPNVMRTNVNPQTELMTYQLVLVDGSDEKSPSIETAVFGTRSNRTNRIAELSPEGFTESDLRIITDSGEVVGSLDRLRITGKLSKDEKDQFGEPCILKIERIERPDLR